MQNGDVDIDMRTLSYHIQQCLEQYKTMYEKMAILPVDLVETFNEINVNNFGRAVAYLTLVYLKNIPENEIREAVHLVVPILRHHKS